MGVEWDENWKDEAHHRHRGLDQKRKFDCRSWCQRPCGLYGRICLRRQNRVLSWIRGVIRFHRWSISKGSSVRPDSEMWIEAIWCDSPGQWRSVFGILLGNFKPCKLLFDWKLVIWVFDEIKLTGQLGWSFSWLQTWVASPPYFVARCDREIQHAF